MPRNVGRWIWGVLALVLIACGYLSWQYERPDRKLDAVHSEPRAQPPRLPPVATRTHARAPTRSEAGRPPESDPLAGLPGETYPIDVLAKDFESLATKANGGDLIAARTLSRALLECRSAPSSAEQVASLATASIDGSHDYSWWPGGAQDYVEHQKRLYLRCGQLSSGQLDSRGRWIEQLAASGDSEARLQYPFEAIPNDAHRTDSETIRQAFVERATAYLQSEIDAGHAEALSAMANGYMRPPIAGAESPFGIDPARAYMYYYAYALSAEGGGYSNSIETILARLEKDIDPQEVSSLRTQAEAIRQRCCN